MGIVMLTDCRVARGGDWNPKSRDRATSHGLAQTSLRVDQLGAIVDRRRPASW